MARIGLIGYGYLGSYVYEQIQTRPELGLDIAFVYNRSPQKLAHPDITRRHGAACRGGGGGQSCVAAQEHAGGDGLPAA